MASLTKVFFNSTTSNYMNSSTAVTVNNDVTQSTASYVTQIALFLIGTVGLVGNLTVIVALCYNRPTRKKLTNWFIINQSTIDLVASVFLIANTATPTVNRFVRPLSADSISDQMFCLIWLTEIPLWSMFMASEYGIVLLSFERYLAIVHPLVHALKFTKNKAICGMVVTWLFGIAYNVAYLIPTSGIQEDGSCSIIGVGSRRVLMTVGFVTFGIQYVAPVVCVLTCYSIMTLALRKRSTMRTDVTLDDHDASTKWKLTCGFGRQLIKFVRRVTSLFCFHVYNVDDEYWETVGEENTKRLGENNLGCYAISTGLGRRDTGETFSVTATSDQYVSNSYHSDSQQTLSRPIKSYENSRKRNLSGNLEVVVEDIELKEDSLHLPKAEASKREIILTERLVSCSNSYFKNGAVCITDEFVRESFPNSTQNVDFGNSTRDINVTVSHEIADPGSFAENSQSYRTKSTNIDTINTHTDIGISHIDITNSDTATIDTLQNTVLTNISSFASLETHSDVDISQSPPTTGRSTVSQLCTVPNDSTKSEAKLSNRQHRNSVSTAKPPERKSANENRQSMNENRLLNLKTEIKLLNKSNSKIVKMLLTVTVCYVCCWTLNEVIFVLNRCNISSSGVPYLYNVSVFLVCLHCCINPFIYTIQYADFQNGVKNIVCKLRSNLQNCGMKGMK